MVVAAILADEEITKPETDFIKQILPIIKKPEDRQELINRIANKKPPSVFRPAGVPPKVLAAVFIELALVMISDIEFTEKERHFLEEVARIFQFEEGYYKELLEWCEEGLEWKNRQLEFVSSTGSVDLLKVPVSKLNPLQQRWYAEALIASIMSDEQLDQAEVKFLKMAINLIKDDNHRREVTALVRRNRKPTISMPPGIPKNYLVRIFIETMLIISADESLTKKERAFLQDLAEKCEFSDNLFQRLVDWCAHGIKWKQAKIPLINKCKISQPRAKAGTLARGNETREDKVYRISRDTEEDDAIHRFEAEEEAPSTPEQNAEIEGMPIEPLPEVEENPENNAITNFNMDCYVCESRLTVKFFQLKEKSQKPRHNIFGIPIYQYAAEGFDPVDYNQCKVAVCHNCYFASPQKEMFRLNSSDKPPSVLNSSEYKQSWLAMKEENRAKIGHHIEELTSIHRSLEAVMLSYEMAIKASSLLAEINSSHEISWHTTTIRLTLAQVLMENERVAEAEDLLRQIQERSEALFRSVKNRFITFRSGRLIILSAVYFGELDKAIQYTQFFEKFREKQFASLSKEDQVLFQRVYGEIRRIMAQPDAYHQSVLNGFLRP